MWACVTACSIQILCCRLKSLPPVPLTSSSTFLHRFPLPSLVMERFNNNPPSYASSSFTRSGGSGRGLETRDNRDTPRGRGGRGRGRGGGRGGGSGKDKIDALGRLLTRILRHMASELNLRIRADGYVNVQDLMKLNLKTFANIPLRSHTIEDIREAARRDSKQRFSLMEEDEKLWIRANQGHTIMVGDDHYFVFKLAYALECKTQTDINQIHSRLITTGLIKNAFLTKNLILSFSSSLHRPLIQFARHVFFQHSLNQPDPFLWNAIIKTFSHGHDPGNAFQVLCLMLESGVFVDEYSFSLMLKACSRMRSTKQGMQIHGLMLKLDFGCDLFLHNCLICMYIKCGCVEFGRQVFDKMFKRDSVSYNSMIDGYVKCGMVDFAREIFDLMPIETRNLITWNTMIGGYVNLEDGYKFAFELFQKMPQRDLVSWNLMLDSCVKCGKIELAHLLFAGMPRRDVVTWGIMINGYAKSGSTDVAREIFNSMPERDVISCNAMMAGYVKNGNYVEALKLFYNMLSDLNLAPDDASLVITLSSIAQLGCIDEGNAIHWYIKENSFLVGGKLGVGLIDMYAKCGDIERAVGVFDEIEEKNIDHWNAMIGGLAIHGLGDLAFDLFMEMERQSLQPDDITFIAVLNACGHAGLVKEGLMCFEIMRRVHELEPKLHHYGCIVDILSRAGLVEAATRFVNDMPIEPNDVVWRTLLSACNNQENLNIGEPVAEHLIDMDSYNSSSYVLLSNMYAQFGLWDCVRKVRSVMKERDVNKIPGCSWIELEGTIHEFFVGDVSNLQVKETCSTLYRSLTIAFEVAYY